MLNQQFWILIILFNAPNSFCIFDDVHHAGKVLSKVRNIIHKATDKKGVVSDGFTLFFNERDNDLRTHIHEIREKLNESSVLIATKLDRIGKSILELPNEIQLHEKSVNIGTFIVGIDTEFDKFLEILEEKEIQVMKQFARVFIDQMIKKFDDMRDRILSPNQDNAVDIGFFSLWSLAMNARITERCGPEANDRRYMLTLYKLLIRAEIELHLITKMAYRALFRDKELDTLLEKQNEKMHNTFLAHSEELINSWEAMNNTYIRSCDPKNSLWIRDKSYFEFYGLVRNVIFTYGLGRLFSGCKTVSCNDVRTKAWAPTCDPRWIHKRSNCDHVIPGSCGDLGQMKACILKNGPRRVLWVESSVKGVMGYNHSFCDPAIGKIVDHTDWNHYNSNSCRCKCTDNRWKIYVSRLQSRERDNYIIVGARFTVKNNILFLQPAEGLLGADFRISEVSWIPLPKNTWNSVAMVDYNHRNFYIGDLLLDAGYAVTGIQFRRIDKIPNHPSMTMFTIAISGRPFKHSTGELDLNPLSRKVVEPSLSGIQKELPHNGGLPIHAKKTQPNKPSSNEFTYVTLEPSDDADFSQSTVPLFDLIPVQVTAPLPLRGIGIFHKGTNEHSGFISIRLYEVDYSEQLKNLTLVHKNYGRQLWNTEVPAADLFL